MREIIFRGKRIDNGEWVEGNLFVSDTDGSTYILAGSRRVTIEWEVDPGTVGQYTGLKDKNGKQIFEGDIIESHYDILYPGDVTIEAIKWYHNSWCIQQGNFLPDSLYGESDLTVSKVTGNIYDNPYLLKEEAQ